MLEVSRKNSGKDANSNHLIKRKILHDNARVWQPTHKYGILNFKRLSQQTKQNTNIKKIWNYCFV